MQNKRLGTCWGALLAAATLAQSSGALASSHREAPFITKNPAVDATDLYLFRSYEPGRADYVTAIANYLPLQDAYGGPNYFQLDPEALYEIHFDNDGDAREDLTFRFQFDNTLGNGRGLTVAAGGKQTKVPLINVGPISAADASNLNVRESYTLQVAHGDRRSGRISDVLRTRDGSKVFSKPVDYIGTKSLGAPAQYESYARSHIHEIKLPDCALPARVFVGQRKESFAVNLGAIFDLVNAPASVIAGGTSRAGRALAPSTIADKNITTLALELPIACLKKKGDVLAAWTTASVRQVRIVNPKPTYELPSFEGGAWTQVSRLGMPLINEVVVGLPDKDRFNGSEPRADAQFLDYVTNPSLPALLEALFKADGVIAPTRFPRSDLVAAFLTGVPGVNVNGSTAEMARLNMAIPPTGKGAQNSLGALDCFVDGALNLDNPGCDPAGFPNGRRPGDDVVDIELRVAMGALLPTSDAPSGRLGFTDAVLQEDAQFDALFPYLTTPNPGAR